MDARLVGITTTVPIEILYAAGLTPVDLNNAFITDPDPLAMVEQAERRGFPRTMCSWVKGIYTAARRRGVGALVAVVQGDCSNTHALMEILESEGVRVVDFAYPYRREERLLEAQLARLAERFGTSLAAAERQKQRFDAIRAVVHEIDRLTWQTGQVAGAENFTWCVNCSDFLGEPERFGADARRFLEEAKARPTGSAAILAAGPVGSAGFSPSGSGIRPEGLTPNEGVRIGLLGVPPICSDLFERLAALGAAVVFNEMPRQFAMPGPSATLLEQYARYTYPYDIFFRLDDVEQECRRREVRGLIHYVQSFCYRQIQDRLIRERLPWPILTLECDRPGPLDGASRTRLEAFVEMLRAGEENP